MGIFPREAPHAAEYTRGKNGRNESFKYLQI